MAAPTGHKENLIFELTGSRTTQAVRDLRSLCELHRHVLIFLSETHFFSDRVDGLLKSLGFMHGLVIGMIMGGFG